jgi:phosphate transport system permease protein
MDSKPTFTGRPRRRTTHPWVKAGDGLARLLITLGGIGTIGAVLLVGVFLFAVAVPLFRAARVAFLHAAPLAHDPAAVCALGCDDEGLVGWMVDGAEARLRLFTTHDGATLADRPLADARFAGATTLRVQPGSSRAIVGYADGSFRVGTFALESRFIPAADLPAGLGSLAVGAARAVGDDVIVRTGSDRYARLSIVAEMAAEPTRALDAPIVDVDATQGATGPLVAALDDRGRVRIETSATRRNLLTDEVVTESAGATIEAEPAADATDWKPAFARVSELGDQLFLIARDGMCRRYQIRAIETPVLMESLDLVPGDAAVTAVARLFGGNAFAVGDSAGVVRVYFSTRADDAVAEDGLRLIATRMFSPQPGGGAVTALAASPRSRLLAVAEATGGVRLLQTTAGREVLRARAPAGDRDAAIDRLVIAPRENVLVAAEAARVAAWAVNAGYPDVSLASLFGRVWYENYPRPVHAWETTGHEAFESKFGLVPLVFGTIKATLYSMLFATPIALLAAIYSSQFMHPRWKARIKPLIEMMASLPSVVLGFVAGLVLAPLLEPLAMTLVAGLFVVPLTLLAGAHLWQLLPSGWRGSLAGWRFAAIALVALPGGVVIARQAAPFVESVLFHGDFRAWLDGRGGSGFGGWVVALLPLSAVAAALTTARIVRPWIRRHSRSWSQRHAAMASLAAFVVGTILAVAIAVAAAMFLDALRFDTRGGLFGTYVQRNALVVALGMSFAIIPLVFTIADDALSSVPEHLRSASLGAGATPWQTAVRVIVPAAASGLFSAVMIGLGRAVGETMIVLMAAGNTPLMDWNLFNGFQTLSAAIATELPEAARGDGHYRVLFLAALVLFGMTFIVNTAAEVVRQRFRRRAHEL